MNTATQQPGRVFENLEALKVENQQLQARAESAELDLREREYEVHVFQDENEKLSREIETLRASACEIDKAAVRVRWSARWKRIAKWYRAHYRCLQRQNHTQLEQRQFVAGLVENMPMNESTAELNLLRVVGIAGKKWDDAMSAMDDFSDAPSWRRIEARCKERMALIELMKAIRDYRKQMEVTSANHT